MKIKSYSLSNMKNRDIVNMLNTINKMGYGPDDYRIVHFGSHASELKVMNQELHWMLKSMTKMDRQKHRTIKKDK